MRCIIMAVKRLLPTRQRLAIAGDFALCRSRRYDGIFFYDSNVIEITDGLADSDTDSILIKTIIACCLQSRQEITMRLVVEMCAIIVEC